MSYYYYGIPTPIPFMPLSIKAGRHSPEVGEPSSAGGINVFHPERFGLE